MPLCKPIQAQRADTVLRHTRALGRRKPDTVKIGRFAECFRELETANAQTAPVVRKRERRPKVHVFEPGEFAPGVPVGGCTRSAVVTAKRSIVDDPLPHRGVAASHVIKTEIGQYGCGLPPLGRLNPRHVTCRIFKQYLHGFAGRADVIDHAVIPVSPRRPGAAQVTDVPNIARVGREQKLDRLLAPDTLQLEVRRPVHHRLGEVRFKRDGRRALLHFHPLARDVDSTAVTAGSDLHQAKTGSHGLIVDRNRVHARLRGQRLGLVGVPERVEIVAGAEQGVRFSRHRWIRLVETETVPVACGVEPEPGA